MQFRQQNSELCFLLYRHDLEVISLDKYSDDVAFKVITYYCKPYVVGLDLFRAFSRNFRNSSPTQGTLIW